jgi:NAD(P)-dependent dehydrogenase (short-subunit alcohol dehydrogenase family)
MRKVWLITGCSRGLGRAMASAVLAAGHELVATARDVTQLNDLAERYGSRVRTVSLDVTNAEACRHAVEQASAAFGKLDVLVNNAGYGDIGSIEDTGIEDFRSQIETNLFGVIHMTKAALPGFRRQGSGHFIQLSSVGGRIGVIGRAPYSAAKWAVEGFSEALAKETAPLGVRVTIIEPGGFRTDFAGASTTLRDGSPAYDSTVGAAARYQQSYDGKQPGDPALAAKIIVKIAAMEKPPFRLLLGSDAVKAVEASDRARLAEIDTWRSLSLSTDFA